MRAWVRVCMHACVRVRSCTVSVCSAYMCVVRMAVGLGEVACAEDGAEQPEVDRSSAACARLRLNGRHRLVSNAIGIARRRSRHPLKLTVPGARSLFCSRHTGRTLHAWQRIGNSGGKLETRVRCGETL
jgi:hypothetical protein